MSGKFPNLFRITTRAATRRASGLISLADTTDTTDYPCSWQPDTAQEVVAQNAQEGRESGKMIYKSGPTLDAENVLRIDGVDGYKVMGPPVRAPGASYLWVPIEREYR